jgi:hypothetical protein
LELGTAACPPSCRIESCSKLQRERIVVSCGHYNRNRKCEIYFACSERNVKNNDNVTYAANPALKMGSLRIHSRAQFSQVPTIPMFTLFSRGTKSKIADCKTLHLGSSSHGSRLPGISTDGRIGEPGGSVGESSGLGGTVASVGGVMVGSVVSGTVGDAVTTVVLNTVGGSVGPVVGAANGGSVGTNTVGGSVGPAVGAATGGSVGIIVSISAIVGDAVVTTVLNSDGGSVDASGTVGDTVATASLNSDGGSVGTGESPANGEFVGLIVVGSNTGGSVTVAVGSIVGSDGVEANGVGSEVAVGNDGVGHEESIVPSVTRHVVVR